MVKKSDLYFLGKYRIPSVRLNGWDYRTPASYFVTICTARMVSCFGSVESGVMKLNELGKFASEYLKGINDHKEDIQLINHVIMPNHVHILLVLKKKFNEKRTNRFGSLIPGSLSSLINHYKGSVTKFSQRNGLYFAGWQERFHDHIIRNQESFDKINQYISSNPLNWGKDRYYRSNFL